MNKKLFSAALFGALLLGTASTFVSCKDYDDDIQNLQTQITANKDAIAQLQTLVGSGNWVSSINSIENGFVVNMSNGQSVTVTGINGKDGANGLDGKNGTEWTIGENGMWYKDGVVTEFKAVATDGKDGAAGAAGVSAPSPSIDENGMWVVYEYDAEAGKFVAKTTEISAQGTAAYAVTANGVVTLHIADETGKYQEIVLPASSDSFVVSAPAAMVDVNFAQGKWAAKAKNTTKAKKAVLAALTEAFPEIEKIEEGELKTQGGKLPVLVNPSNVKLTNDFTYSLVDVEGNVAKATLSDPVEGLPEGTTVEIDPTIGGIVMTTRAADAKDCFWTLNVTLEKNKKGEYESFTTPHALVIENANGTVVKTPFAYMVTAANEADVVVSDNATSGVFTASYAEEIDVLADVYGTAAPFKSIFDIKNGMTGKYVLSVEDAADADRYGVTVEGSKLMIAKYPSNATTITIKGVKLIALGLNGSTAEATINLTVTKSMVPTAAPLKAPVITLSTATGLINKVRWNVADLGFSASQMQDLWEELCAGSTRAATTTATNKVTVTYTQKGKTTPVVNEYELNAYNAAGTCINETALKTNKDKYKDVVKLGFDFKSDEMLPNELTEDGYKVVVSIGTKYVAETTMTISNPENTLVGNENVVNGDVIVLTKKPTFDADSVKYDLTKAFTQKEIVAGTLKFEDMDRENDEDSWIDGDILKVYKYNVKDADGVRRHDIGVERTIKATYSLFTAANKVEKEFKVKVVSEVYDAAHENVKVDKALTTFYFGGAIEKPAKTELSYIDLTAAIKATLAAGEDKGKTILLYPTTKPGTSTAATYNYSNPADDGSTAGSDGSAHLVKNAANFVTVTEEVYQAALGMKTATGADHYITTNMWAKVWAAAQVYYKKDGSVITKSDSEYVPGTTLDTDGKTVKVPTTDVLVNIFKAYGLGNKIDFPELTAAIPGGTVADQPRDFRLSSVLFTFTDQAKADKFLSLPSVTPASDGVKYYNITSISAKALTALTGSEASTASHTVEVNALITDKWGMTMKVPFTLTIKTSK